jgi:hypothetical protein
MRALLILVALLALPATARAELFLPAEVVPGEPVVVSAELGLVGAPVRLSVDDGGVVGGVVGADASARFVMPATYGERRFLPGQEVSVSVCSIPVLAGSPAGGIVTSSTFCVGGSTVVGGRVRALLRGRVEPRRVGALRNARWTGWGTGSARARGVAGGRRATAVASGLVDCGGFAAYSRLTIRGVAQTLKAC